MCIDVLYTGVEITGWLSLWRSVLSQSEWPEADQNALFQSDDRPVLSTADI